MPVEVTWWGHATCTVEDSGVRVLTDPLFVRRLAHLRRRRGELPPAEAARRRCRARLPSARRPSASASLARLAPGTRLVVPRGALRAVPGLRRLGRGCGCGSPRSAPGDEVRGRRADGTGGARARTTGGGCRSDRTARPRSAMSSSGEARTYFAGDTGLFDGDGRGGRPGRCGAAAGRRLGAVPRARASGRRAGGAGAGRGWRRAARCRCTTARTGRSGWTRSGRTNSTRRARSSRARRRGWRREVAVHRLGHGETRQAGGRLMSPSACGDLGAVGGGRRDAAGVDAAGGRLSVAVPAGGARRRWCRWCRRGRWSVRRRWSPSTRRAPLVAAVRSSWWRRSPRSSAM